jgi:cytidine deaminase
MNITEETFGSLFSAAISVRENSCSAHSGFKVGAAVLTKKGNIYSGCNIESSSYGLTMCAERNALSNALCAGEREFEAILITAGTSEPVPPCGACRQLLYDYAPDLIVIMTNLEGKRLIENITELLKYPFGLENKLI